MPEFVALKTMSRLKCPKKSTFIASFASGY